MVFARLACHRLVANGSRWTLGESTWSDRSSRSDQKTATEQPEARQKKKTRDRVSPSFERSGIDGHAA